jgi:aryl-alcohol dehydrogenase-like predicted oxidoreductase
LEYQNLGRSGLKVSQLTLGCMSFGDPKWRPWILDADASRPVVKRALDLGVNLFDTADYYSLGESETVLGGAIRALTDRRSVVIATKVFAPMIPGPNGGGLSRKHIMEAVDASLQRLGTDYIDLYQIHRLDPATPIEETLDALNDIVRAGKVRYLGASSMPAWEFMKAIGIQRREGWAHFISMQNHYNLIYREEEREMIPLCRSEGVGLIPWSALARGFLAGKARGAATPPSIRAGSDDMGARFYGAPADDAVLAALTEVADRLGHSCAEIAIAWLASRPGVVSPLIGITRVEQLESAAAAVAIRLDDADVALLEMPYQPRAVAY